MLVFSLPYWLSQTDVCVSAFSSLDRTSVYGLLELFLFCETAINVETASRVIAIHLEKQYSLGSQQINNKFLTKIVNSVNE